MFFLCTSLEEECPIEAPIPPSVKILCIHLYFVTFIFVILGISLGYYYNDVMADGSGEQTIWCACNNDNLGLSGK